MKPIPTSSMHFPTCSGVRARPTPRASSTSALPHLLDIARFPCLATGTPAPATTKAAAVEMLNVLSLSPPVPHVSTTSACRFVGILTHFSRIVRAKPVTSCTVSPFIRRAVIRLAICAGVASPSMISCITCAASVSVRSFPPTTFPMASLIIRTSSPCAKVTNELLRAIALSY